MPPPQRSFRRRGSASGPAQELNSGTSTKEGLPNAYAFLDSDCKAPPSQGGAMVPRGASKDTALPKIDLKNTDAIFEYTKNLTDVNKDATILHPKNKREFFWGLSG